MAVLKNLDVVFSNNILERKASELIRRYACQRKWIPSLPLPVDSLIEHTLDLCIEYDAIDEPVGTIIWGCIEPDRRTITLNQNHAGTFAGCPGLERFTLGHEVGHWVMHIDQGELSQSCLFEASPERIVCRDGDDSIHERVADRFSAFLLMPKDLVMAKLSEHEVVSREGFRRFAECIGVSYKALSLRLSKLGVTHYE